MLGLGRVHYLDEQEVATLFVEVVKLDWVSTPNNDSPTKY